MLIESNECGDDFPNSKGVSQDLTRQYGLCVNEIIDLFKKKFRYY